MEMTKQIEIIAPVETVFECLANDEIRLRWMDELVETQYPDGRNESDMVGTRIVDRIKQGSKITSY